MYLQKFVSEVKFQWNDDVRFVLDRQSSWSFIILSWIRDNSDQRQLGPRQLGPLIRQLGPLLEDNSDHFWGQLGPIFRVKSDHFYVSYNHFLKTTWTTFLGQLGPILMAIHPVLLNANWYSHRQKLTISFKNCLSETRFYSIILYFSSNFQ